MDNLISEAGIDAKNVAARAPIDSISFSAAIISLLGTVMFLVLVAALHFLKPDFDPSWRFISEYAIGEFGWVMTIAFFFWALGYLGLFVALRSEVPTIGGKIGVWLLLLIAATIVLAGIFAADPVTATENEKTSHGALHGLGGMIGMPGTVVAFLLISYSLARNPNWRRAGRILKLTAHLTWITLALLFGTLAITLSANNGVFGPSVLIGWPNRLLVAAFGAWLIAAAWYAIKIRRQKQGNGSVRHNSV